MPSDVPAAVQAQNVQVSAGQIGAQPAVAGPGSSTPPSPPSRGCRRRSSSATSSSRPTPDGAVVQLGDVARVELGADTYAVTSLFNGHPAAGVAIMLAPGANALKTVDAVKAKARRAAASLPPGMKLIFPIDNTTFIRLSIHDVVMTLIEAIALVVLVMYRVPAELARHPDPGHRRAGGAAGHLRRAGGGRLFHQHADPVRPGAGDRPAGRRRHRGGGECRAHHARGAAAAPRGHPQERWRRSPAP